MLWGLNYHQSKGVLTEIDYYWLIQLANRIMNGQKWKEPGMIMQVIRKAPEEKGNCPHNIIDQNILSILFTIGRKIKL